MSFASDVEVHLDAVPVSMENQIRIRTEVSLLQTRGMTNLSGGWFAGVECAARVAEEDVRMTPRIIILSDGHANEGISDSNELREHAGELRLRGVLTSALGIGDAMTNSSCGALRRTAAAVFMTRNLQAKSPQSFWASLMTS